MKVSEAIMTGISVFKLNPYLWVCQDGGCLLGIAGRAEGIKFGDSLALVNDSIDLIVARWPWLNQSFDVPDFLRELPQYGCEDGPYNMVPQYKTFFAKGIISYLAMQVKMGNVSIEKVVDWIRSIEPQDEQTEISGQGPVAVSLEVHAL